MRRSDWRRLCRPVEDEGMAQLGRSSVSIADLVKAGLLRSGERLVFRKGDQHAEVTGSGTIRYQGKDYTSPSTAAKAAAGGTSTNGWIAWSVSQGDTLADLRDRHGKT